MLAFAFSIYLTERKTRQLELSKIRWYNFGTAYGDELGGAGLAHE
jgi:hypothetical protein